MVFFASLLCMLLGGLPARAAEDGLALHLPFDGSVAPTVGKDLGAPEVKGSPEFVEGKHGQAIKLTGNNHLLVKLPSAVRAGEFSISLWMKPLWHPNDNIPHAILEIPADPKNRDAVGWAAHQLVFSKGWSDTIAPNNLYGVVDSDIGKRHLRPNQWTHVVLVYSLKGQFTGSYFDGEGERRPEKELKPLDPPNETMWLGARAYGGVPADIVVDDLKVFERPLRPDEIPGVAGEKFPPPRDYSLLGTECDPAQAVQTPHVQWANPYVDGPVQVLFITEGKRAREVLELAQRVAVRPYVVTGPAIDKHTLANPETFHALGQRAEEILRKAKIDCVVIGGFGWNLFEASTREAMMAFVRAGGGLLFVDPMCVGGEGAYRQYGHGNVVGWEETPEGKQIESLVQRLERRDEEYLTAGIPWSALSMFRTTLGTNGPTSLFHGGKVGEGRILIYDIYLGNLSSHESLTPSIAYDTTFNAFDYDYAVGAAAKAVLWAAGKASAVTISRVTFQASRELSPRMYVGVPGNWQVVISNPLKTDVQARLQLTARTRGPEAPHVVTHDVIVKPGLNNFGMPHRIAFIGEVFADVRLSIDGKAADWATGTVRVASGNPRFLDLVADRTAYTSGEQPRITASLNLRQYNYKKGETAQLRWRLYDLYGRLLHRGEREVALNYADDFTARENWTLPALDEASLSYKLVAELVRNDLVTDQRTLNLRRKVTGFDDFMFTSWPGNESPSVQLADLVLRDHYGLDCLGAVSYGRPIDDRYREQLQWLSENNFRPWIYAAHLGGGANERNERKPDMADDDYLQKMQARLAEAAKVTEPYSPLYYSLGDEVVLGNPNAQATEDEQKSFREQIKAKYGKLESLNKAWETEYKSWDGITIPSFEELQAGKGNSRLRVELNDFRESLFARMTGIAVEGIRKIAPEARVGTEGIFGLTHAYSGFDYAKVTPGTTFMGMYATGMEMNMVRSFQQPGDLLGAWWNYAMLDEEYSRFAPWHLLLNGAHTLMWFTDFSCDRYTALNPDFTPFDHFKWMYEELEPIEEGIGKLVLGLQREPAQVAVLYEQKNLHRTTPFFHSMVVLTKLLDDLGVQHDFVSGKQIVEGTLTKRKYRLLLLPGQFHMSPEVAAAVRGFVAVGGAAMADTLPAEADGLNRYGKRPLDDLFADAGSLKHRSFPVTDADAAGWESHWKKTGKGKAFLLGFHPGDYGRKRMTPEGGPLRKVASDILASCGVKPPAQVRCANGPFQPVQVVCYRDGDALYVGTQRDYMVADQTPRAFGVTTERGGHLYDTRAGKYLGEGTKAMLNLEVARGAMLAILPYKATGIAIEGLQPTLPQGASLKLALRLQIEGGLPGKGVFRVDVTDPNGSPVAPVCRKVRWEKGAAEVVLPLAYNDPVGKWTIRVTDIATGTATEQTFQLEAVKL